MLSALPHTLIRLLVDAGMPVDAIDTDALQGDLFLAGKKGVMTSP
jgi:hypothetical protein